MTTTTASASDERLYQLARRQARVAFGGTGFDNLGAVLQRALVLAEVTALIGQQDDEDNPMVRLAAHAVIRSYEEAPR